jgi:2-polyprenyl-6-methoxyphenol hydroxylase-like FAD-dependent oxidoreductase
MDDHQPDRAVVIGGSIAGLLAARVLADHFGEVCVLERDELPDAAGPRKGTPQANHTHGLLARGRMVMEQLFPGFTEGLVARGGLTGDLGVDVALDADRRRFARTRTGCTGVLASRLAIEAELRQRTRAWPRVRFVTGVDVQEPCFDPATSRVTGVRYAPCQRASEVTELAAALVIDCTGRGSHSPAWLDRWGFEAPPEERVRVDLSYTTAYFVRDPDEPADTLGVISVATPGLPRPAVVLAQEPDAAGRARWVASVGGYGGDHPEVSLEAMRSRARHLGAPELLRLTERGELVGEVLRYRFPHSQRRHYERLARFPAGYLVMGDAIASFNPIYGQGMTVAACEALALGEALNAGRPGLARRFFRAASRLVDIPWQLAVGADLALPVVPGRRPAPVRLVNAYIGRLQRAAAWDPVVASAFLMVMHLVNPPPTLFAPRILWRVLARGGHAAGAREGGAIEWRASMG